MTSREVFCTRNWCSNHDDSHKSDSFGVREKVTSWKLKAFKYYYIPLKGIGLGGIVVEPTADLIRLQKELIDAIAPFMAPASSGTVAAFATTPDEPEINQPTIDAVATYLSGHTGEHYSPHVTIGVGTVEYLEDRKSVV